VGAAAVAARIAGAVAYVHGAGVAHGDLKPSNVVVGPGGAPYLIDFNLSTREAGPAGARGTPGYMAPELLDAAADPHAGGVDLARADLFALGVVVYELLTGRPPFPPADPKSFAAQSAAARTPPAPLAAVCSPDVAAALAACLSPDPAARPATAAVLAEALDRFVDGARNPAPEPAPAAVARRPARGLGRRRVAAAAVGVVLAAAVGGALRERLLRPDAPPVPPEEKPAAPAPPPGPAVPIAFRPPGTAQEFFARGWAAMKAEDWTGARADFLTSDKLQKNPWVVALAAYCETAGRLHKESVGHAEWLVGENVATVDVLNNLGYALIQSARVEEAVGPLDAALARESGMPAARYNRAFALYLIGQRPEGRVDRRAADDIRVALDAGLSSHVIHFEAAQIYAACADQSPALRADARNQIRAAIRAGRSPSQCHDDATLRGRLRTGFGSTLAFEAACATPQGAQPAKLPQLRLVEPRPF
jgi:eukaryotic-like serine/threonine-protein kinase